MARIFVGGASTTISCKGELRFDTGRPDGVQLKGLDSTPLRHVGLDTSVGLRAALERTYESFQAHPETWEETPIVTAGEIVSEEAPLNAG